LKNGKKLKKAFAEMKFVNGEKKGTPDDYEFQASIHGWKEYNKTNKGSMETAKKLTYVSTWTKLFSSLASNALVLF
jgi:hypothetical protein